MESKKLTNYLNEVDDDVFCFVNNITTLKIEDKNIFTTEDIFTIKRGVSNKSDNYSDFVSLEITLNRQYSKFLKYNMRNLIYELKECLDPEFIDPDDENIYREELYVPWYNELKNLLLEYRENIDIYENLPYCSPYFSPVEEYFEVIDKNIYRSYVKSNTFSTKKTLKNPLVYISQNELHYFNNIQIVNNIELDDQHLTHLLFGMSKVETYEQYEDKKRKQLIYRPWYKKLDNLLKKYGKSIHMYKNIDLYCGCEHKNSLIISDSEKFKIFHLDRTYVKTKIYIPLTSDIVTEENKLKIINIFKRWMK